MKLEDLKFFNPHAAKDITRNWLPHWQQDDRVYFVTFRLADAVPQDLLKQWEAERTAWLLHHPEPWNSEVEKEYHQRFSTATEQWLDAGHGSCVLRQEEYRRIVADALAFFDGQRCDHLAWIVMPNHIHALFVLRGEETLEDLLHSWKRFTAHKINKLLQREGTLWQKDYFDRLVRDVGHFANCVRYIRRNPEKAHLRQEEFTLFESDLAKSIL